jgi:hypothetical protein
LSHKCTRKLALCDILAGEPTTPKYLNWSEYPIQFSRKDQWTNVSNISHYPLVLGPLIASMTVPKVLIDGGTRLNIIFADTLKNRLGFHQPTYSNRCPFLLDSTQQSCHATRTDHTPDYVWHPKQFLNGVHQVRVGRF